MKHDLLWFEKYAKCADFLEPLTPQEWKELAALLHDVNSVQSRSDRPADGHNWMKPENYPACMVKCSTAKPNCDRAFVRCTAKPAAQGEGQT